MHDANQVMMGSTDSSDKQSTNYAADPANFKAGTAVRLDSDGLVSVDEADGQLIGVSLGDSLSKTEKLSVCRAGLRVPLLLTSGYTPAVGDRVYIDDETGLGRAEPEGEEEHTVTETAAIYVSGPLDAVERDGTVTVDGVAYIDMPGGL